MIGPIAPGATFLTVADFGVTTPTAPAVELDDATGAAAIARSTTGIVNLGGNTYGKTLTAPLSNGFYTPLWDDNGGTQFADEVVWVTGAVATIPTVVGPGAATPYTADNPFTMKRGDTVPIFGPVQLQKASGANYAPPVGGTVMITVQKLPGSGFTPPDDFQAVNRVYHATVPAYDGTAGWTTGGSVSYRFPKGAVNWIGYCLIEIESNEPGGDVWTFPGAQATPEYIPARFFADEDAGVDP